MSWISRAGRQFVGGEWVASSSPEVVEVENPATGAAISAVCAGTADDAGRAVAAARSTFAAWSSTAPSDRVTVVRRAASLLRGRAEELAEAISTEVGSPLTLSRAAQVGRPLDVLDALCDAVFDIPWSVRVGTTAVVREPVGVVAAITPWNFPLHQSVAKVGAALLAGCTVVHKPSELAPHSSYVLADVLADAGLPPGAYNVVTGLGSTVGAALVRSRDVDAVSFTGSVAVGKRIARVGSDTVKRVTLELGGKSPALVLPGADVAQASVATAERCFTNAGQVCAGLSRLLVPRESQRVAEEALVSFVSSLTMGDPFAPDTGIGPLISAQQRQRVSGLVTQALAEGARLVTGGPGVAVPPSGHYFAPTVLSDVNNAMTIAQEEVFGPVLCVMTYDSVDEAIDIANGTPYGLVASVWGDDAAGATAVARRIRAGMVGINGGRINIRAPFGGYKHSGYGREFGSFGIEEFLEVKSINYTSVPEMTF